MADEPLVVIVQPPPPETQVLVQPPQTVQVQVAAPDQLVVHLGIAQGMAGPQGELGPTGPAGSPGGRLRKAAAGILSGGRAVRVTDDLAEVASALDPAHARTVVGVSLTSAAVPGEEIDIVNGGEYEDSSLSLVPDALVYVGASGELTQVVTPGWAFIRVLGFAVSPTKMIVQVRPPIYLV